MLAALAVVAVVGGLYYLHGRNFEETDDAQIDGNISNIGPRVAGTVTAVYVVENQFVKADDALLEIDPTDLQVAVAQAKASVAQAEAQLQAEDPSVSITQTSNTALVAGASSELLSATAGLTGAEKDVEQLNSRLVQAEANAQLAEIEKKRGEDLWKAQAIPRADYDRRITTAETTAAEVQAAQHALSAARARVSQQKAQLGATRQADGGQAERAPAGRDSPRVGAVPPGQPRAGAAQLRQAELNLGYAKVRTPVPGIVAQEGGQRRRSRRARAVAGRGGADRRAVGDRQLSRDADPAHAAGADGRSARRRAATSMTRAPSRASAAPPARASACCRPRTRPATT